MPKHIVLPKNNKLPGKLTFTGTLNPIHFELMYRIKIKRICKGYSQQELAFLLGKDREYISTREHFEEEKTYALPDINRLAFILDYDCRSFIPARPNKIKVTYTGSEVRENGKIYHEVSIKTGASHKLLFKVEEDDPEVNHFPASDEHQLAKLEAFIATLCEIGYFAEAKTPFQLFLCCSRTIPGYTSARLVDKVSNHFIQQKMIKKVIKEEYIAFKV